MTLVVHATAGMPAESVGAVRRLFAASGFTPQSSPMTMGPETLYYYTTGRAVNADGLIAELLRVPGVTAAYVKPEGAPP